VKMVAIAAFVTAAATSRMRRLATTARRHCRRLPDTASTAVSKIGFTVLIWRAGASPSTTARG